MLVKAAHSAEELDAIIRLRYKILREPWSQSTDTAQDHLEHASVNAYIEHQGKVIACGRLQENEGKKGQVRFMAIDENFQGKGLGKKILLFLEEQAKEMSLNEIELQARENAVKFYNSNGYTVKEKTFLLWGIIQHYLMIKKIT